jgi:aromatic-L-amino-acid decarboxylase
MNKGKEAHMDKDELWNRIAPLEIASDEFRKIGYQVVDQLADFLASLPDRPVTRGETPTEIRKLLGTDPLPDEGTALEDLLSETAELLINHSLFNGHPRFWGYITSSAAPVGAFADFIAATINSNVGAWIISPMATEIEAQTIRWVGEMIGYPPDCGGLLVSGGNVANFVGFMTARKAKVPWDARAKSIAYEKGARLVVYCSAETHTWIEKAVDRYGIGTDSLRWIATDDNLQMNTTALRDQIIEDKRNGHVPFLVIGTAGSTAVGVIDPLPSLSEICQEYDLWFHVDAAYGGFAACLSDAPSDLKGLSEADSVAIDPHKWLYAPLEAGIVLVRDPNKLREAFSHHPPSYYEFEGEEHPINYYE